MTFARYIRPRPRLSPGSTPDCSQSSANHTTQAAEKSLEELKSLRASSEAQIGPGKIYSARSHMTDMLISAY